MVDRTIEGRPSSLPTVLRAALPVLPGVGQLPWVRRAGTELPDLTLHRNNVAVDPAHVRAYSAVCGFEKSQHLPLTYPHVLAFGLHLVIMTDPSFPFPAVGTVHVANTVHQHRPIAASERLDVSARAVRLRPHPKGRVFDLVTSVGSDGATVWESTSTYLRRGHGDKSGAPEGRAFEVLPGTGGEWKLAGNLGRRYASVSGDHNPIHLYPLTAKAFGFNRQIAHGMWSKARCIAAIASRLPDEVTVEVEFKKPIFLPGTVAFGSELVADGIDFSLTSPGNGAVHLVGRSR
ncbi:MAG: hypothetical protein M3Z50_03725 [Actinomycetota bacterium]|nr:hypothetical protein [Actinomycetota bacterium]